jgi:hypothetical protein
MATLSNKALNTASPTNKEIMVKSADITWEDTDPSTWAEAQGTWAKPYFIKNKTLNTGSLTNKSAPS